MLSTRAGSFDLKSLDFRCFSFVLIAEAEWVGIYLQAEIAGVFFGIGVSASYPEALTVVLLFSEEMYRGGLL